MVLLRRSDLHAPALLSLADFPPVQGDGHPSPEGLTAWLFAYGWTWQKVVIQQLRWQPGAASGEKAIRALALQFHFAAGQPPRVLISLGCALVQERFQARRICKRPSDFLACHHE